MLDNKNIVAMRQGTRTKNRGLLKNILRRRLLLIINNLDNFMLSKLFITATYH
jgi:hypothetical protein